jgi:dTMP kinase
MRRIPDRGTTFGEMINGFLASKVEVDDAILHLLFSANRWERRLAMLEALKGGTKLVVYRYRFIGGAAATDAVAYLSIDIKVG